MTSTTPAAPPPPLVTSQRFRMRSDVREISLDKIESVSTLPIRGDRNLLFIIPHASSRCVALSGVQLHLQLKLVAGLGGGKVAGGSNYIIPGVVPLTIFERLVVKVNDKEVVSAAEYPLYAAHLMRILVPQTRRHLIHQLGGFTGSDSHNLSKGSATVGGKKVDRWSFDSSKFAKVNDRSGDWKSGEVQYFSTFLLTDLGGNDERPLVLPPCDIGIELTPALPSRSILTDLAAPTELRVEIQAAHLTVPRILPRAERIPRSLAWDFVRVSLSPLVVEAGRREIHSTVMYNGVFPRRLTVLALGHRNWEGTFRHSILRSEHFDISSIELRCGSRVIPNSRIRSDFESGDIMTLFAWVSDSLRHSTRKTGSELDLKQWAGGGEFLWACDLTSDASAGSSVRGRTESGAVSLSLQFAKPLRSNITLLVIAENVHRLVIESHGGVSVRSEGPPV